MNFSTDCTLVYEGTWRRDGTLRTETIYHHNSKPILIWRREENRYSLFFSAWRQTQHWTSNENKLDYWINQAIEEGLADIFVDNDEIFFNEEDMLKLKGLDGDSEEFRIKKHALNYHRIIKFPEKTKKMLGWKI